MKTRFEYESAKVLFPSDCELGESPLWHAERGSCFWVDIENKNIYEYGWRSGLTRQYNISQKISLVVVAKNNLIVGLQGGVFRYNLETQNLTKLTDLAENWHTHRCNDGIIDNMGRLWISTMDLEHSPDAGRVYCISDRNSFKRVIEEATIPNGMAWSVDGARLYYIDSASRRVNSYFYEKQTGSLIFERTVITIPNHLGIPDGMTIDLQGRLWIALWGGYGVGCFDVEASMMTRFVNVPAPYVTSCTFAGEELDHLVITTAIADMTAEERLRFPQSGHTFVYKPGVSGIADFICSI